MSHATPDRARPTPHVLAVVAGMASVPGQGFAPLEHARLESLAAIARWGRVARLRTLSPLLPPCELTVAAALLGQSPPDLVDRAAITAASLGLSGARSADEHAVLVDVLGPASEPAPALDVARAAARLTHHLGSHTVHLAPPGSSLLITGPSRPSLPSIDGLDLRIQPPGWAPSATATATATGGTVVVAEADSPLLDLARLIGARGVAVDGMRVGRRRAIEIGLRDAACAELAGGAARVIVETRALVPLRLRPREPATRRRELVSALEAVDRTLLGPLRAAADWCRAELTVTTDLLRDDAGRIARGDVPIVTLARGQRTPSGMAAVERTGPLGLALAPPYAETSLRHAPIVTSPWSAMPEPLDGPRRFVRDPTTGVTSAALRA